MSEFTAPEVAKENIYWATIKNSRGLLITILLLAILPFIIALVDGQPFSELLSNDPGQSKFYQALMIEIFILAVYAISYDLIFGITGMISFGHAMFFGVGAYVTGIMFKSFGWSLLPTIGLVILAGIVNALIFGILLPRVKGITWALVTLGIAEVFFIVIQSRELVDFAGAEIGLQGVTPPEYLNPVTERLRFYYLAMIFMILVYIFYKRFVNSPTGRVCIANRENENRAIMLGYNTFWYKLTALIISSVTAGLAGALHAIFHPIIRPDIAGLSFTIAALLMVLIGGVGTLSGALIGAATFRLLSFGLDRYLGGSSQIIIGIVYVGIVLYLPFGIVGTWNQRSVRRKEGREQLLRMFTGSKEKKQDENEE